MATTPSHLNVAVQVDPDDPIAAKVDELLTEHGHMVVDALDKLGVTPEFAMHTGPTSRVNYIVVDEPAVDDAAAVEAEPSP